jgi:ribokinase
MMPNSSQVIGLPRSSSSTPKAIVVVGSINTDLVATTPRLPRPGETITGSCFATFQGGKGANQAVAAAQLGATVTLIGKVGSDAFGSTSIHALQSRGVQCDHVAQEPGDSGVAVITVDASGQNSIVVIPGSNAHVTPDFVESKRSVIREAAIVLAQLEIPLGTVLRLARICREERVPFMLDPAPAIALPPELFTLCDWFTPNETEAAFYAQAPFVPPPQAAAALHALGVQNVVLKLGQRGAYIDGPAQSSHQVPSIPVKAVDTTAAGDTFNAAFSAALVDGKDIPTCGLFAAAAAALSVTRAGAQSSMPSLAEVLAVLSNRPT